MNKELLDNINMTITEGYGRAMNKLYHEMHEYKTLCEKIISVREQLKSDISAEHLETFAQFARANSNKSYFEQRYMYIQGMKDYNYILQFINDGALDKYLLDYDFKYANAD